jgi:glycosyltransferase involved in cell wall biosynthesis
VAVRWAGPAQLLEGLDSMLVPPSDEAAVVHGLAGAMNRLATDPDRAQEVARTARARARAAFRWEAVLDQWSTVYDRAMHEREHAGRLTEKPESN